MKLFNISCYCYSIYFNIYTFKDDVDRVTHYNRLICKQNFFCESSCPINCVSEGWLTDTIVVNAPFIQAKILKLRDYHFYLKLYCIYTSVMKWMIVKIFITVYIFSYWLLLVFLFYRMYLLRFNRWYLIFFSHCKKLWILESNDANITEIFNKFNFRQSHKWVSSTCYLFIYN